MRVFLMGTMLIMASSIYAQEIDLVKITSDTDPIPSYMYVVLNDNNDIAEFGKKDLDKHGKVVKRQVFSTELDYEGVVLKKRKGRKVVIMRGHNIGPTYGGLLELDFLYNGVTGSRKFFKMSLARDINKWMVKVKDKLVRHLHFKVHRKRFIGIVGIRGVQIVK